MRPAGPSLFPAEAAGAGERVERKDIDPDDERVFPQGPVEKPAKGRR